MCLPWFGWVMQAFFVLACEENRGGVRRKSWEHQMAWHHSHAEKIYCRAPKAKIQLSYTPSWRHNPTKVELLVYRNSLTHVGRTRHTRGSNPDLTVIPLEWPHLMLSTWKNNSSRAASPTCIILCSVYCTLKCTWFKILLDLVAAIAPLTL